MIRGTDMESIVIVVTVGRETESARSGTESERGTMSEIDTDAGTAESAAGTRIGTEAEETARTTEIGTEARTAETEMDTEAETIDQDRLEKERERGEEQGKNFPILNIILIRFLCEFSIKKIC